MTTCTFCRSNVVRHDMDLKSMGKVAQLLSDLSPFQVGTTGVYDNTGFYLAGRIKLMYDGGTWSEWYALFDDGREGWLAEAQGFYMMSFARQYPGGLPHPDDWEPGKAVEVDGIKFVADDLRWVEYFGSEGELPFVYQQGYMGFSVDFRSKSGDFANILYGEDEPSFYVGRYQPFSSFSFSNLKEVHGWESEQP